MEQARIAELLEKYWRAETTVEEERQLADYFRQPVIPAEWEPWRNVFAYFEAEAQITPGKDFDVKLMERIRSIEVAGQSGSGLSSASDPGPASVPAPVRPLFRRAPWWAAAAVIILALGISRLAEHAGSAPRASGSIAESAPGAYATDHDAGRDVAPIKDTYDDPQQALAAIQRALRTVSLKMNHGKSIAQNQMDRMYDGWRSAITK